MVLRAAFIAGIFPAAVVGFFAPTVPKISLSGREAQLSMSSNSGNSGPSTRRAVLDSAWLAAAGLGVLTSTPAYAAEPDYAAVKAAVQALVAKNPDWGPTIVRLAWHASGSYSKPEGNGGSYGGTIRFGKELAHGGNAGLDIAVKWMEPLKKANPAISYGDLYTLAGVAAIEAMGGPAIKWRAGRQDMPEDAVTPDGRLPAADKGNPMATAQGLREVFYRMGFNDQEIVALSGAHALGRCHTNASGYEGPWTPVPTQFGNLYFTLLKSVKWTKRDWDGPFQYEDPSGKLMMLPSDLVLLSDKSFKKYVDLYADDKAKFYADFAVAFNKLEELGCNGLRDV